MVGFVGCSSGAGRLPGNLARTWLALGDDGGCGQPLPRPGFRVTPLGLGRKQGRWWLRAASAGLSGSLARTWARARPARVWPGFRVTPLGLGRKQLRAASAGLSGKLPRPRPLELLEVTI